MAMNTKIAHILVFPFPAQGHMIPLLDLAHSLAASSHALALTLLTTPLNEPLLQPLLTAASSQGLHVQSLILPLPPTPGLPPNCENVAQLPLHLLPLFIYSFQQLAHPLEEWIRQQQRSSASDGFGPPLCIISDFFLGWTQDTAAKLGIPRIVFHSSGAFSVSVISSVWKHMPHEGVESDEGEVHIADFPHPLSFRKYQISRLARSCRSADPVSDFIRYTMNLNLTSWGALINTFYALEPLYIDHLQAITGRPVWSVGPLLPPVVFAHKNNIQRGNPNSINEALCLQWLDSRKEKSVVYVCFGSQTVLSEKQIQHIAAGLEASEESFIWVIKDPHPTENSNPIPIPLPQGFEERSKDRGLVIRGWAPQLLILSHSSVGGFLTHCGWNSILESVTLGVPLITWPMTADQYSNALLLVEYLGVGVRLCEGATTVPDIDDLKSALKRVLRREGEEMKRPEELSKAARVAVQQGGSSSTNLEDCVSQIHQLTQY